MPLCTPEEQNAVGSLATFCLFGKLASCSASGKAVIM